MSHPIDLNSLLHLALKEQLKRDRYYDPIEAGRYRSGAVAACPWRVGLRTTLASRKLEKLLLPVDQRYLSYGRFIHEGIGGLLVSAFPPGGEIDPQIEVYDEVWATGRFAGGIEVSSRADLVIVRRLPSGTEVMTVEEKTCSANAAKYYPEKFPYKYHKLQAFLAHINIVDTLRRGEALQWRDKPLQPKLEQPVFSAALYYYPRDVVKQSPDWFLRRYHYREEDIDRGWVDSVIGRWHDLYISVSENVNVDLRELESFFEEMGMSEIFCENCDCRSVCPRFNPEEYSRVVASRTRQTGKTG